MTLDAKEIAALVIGDNLVVSSVIDGPGLHIFEVRCTITGRTWDFTFEGEALTKSWKPAKRRVDYQVRRCVDIALAAARHERKGKQHEG